MRKKGLSGLMRVKNEGRFIGTCIDSCINALDELVVVCFDCTDDTHEILARKQKQYPDKLRVYDYNHDVLAFDLSREEYELAKTLPADSKRLYCNLCNYGLSKTSYEYVTKIDADQLYFEDELKQWRDVCSGEVLMRWHLRFVVGWLFMMYFSLYRRLSARRGVPCLGMIPDWLVRACIKPYIDFSKWQLQRGKACITLSGVNVFKDDAWYIPFDGRNIHPPYNGEGDTVIFKVTDETFWSRRFSDRITYSVTEHFNNPYKQMFTYPVWFHLHANRVQCWSKVKQTKDRHPDWFVPVSQFTPMTYREVHDKMDKKAHTLYQRTLFALIHKIGTDVIRRHEHMLSGRA